MKQQEYLNIFDLWGVLLEQKKTIFLVLVASVFVGVVYMVLAKPEYKAEIFLLPPSKNDIQALNVDPKLQEYTTQFVYRAFVRELKSRSNRRLFFDENNIAIELGFDPRKNGSTDYLFETEFNSKMKVVKGKGVVKGNKNGKKIDGEFVSVILSSSSAENATKWLNRFIDSTERLVVKRLVSDVQLELSIRKASIENRIMKEKRLALRKREDRIIRLEEALVIAEKLSGNGRGLRDGGRYESVAINADNVPLYMLGDDVLREEIAVLKKRKDDAPFIAVLRPLQENLVNLNRLMKIDASHIKSAFVDQAAIVPKSPEKPKKVLLLIISAAIGLIMGIMIAFLINAYDMRRTKNV